MTLMPLRTLLSLIWCAARRRGPGPNKLIKCSTEWWMAAWTASSAWLDLPSLCHPAINMVGGGWTIHFHHHHQLEHLCVICAPQESTPPSPPLSFPFLLPCNASFWSSSINVLARMRSRITLPVITLWMPLLPPPLLLLLLNIHANLGAVRLVFLDFF